MSRSNFLSKLLCLVFLILPCWSVEASKINLSCIHALVGGEENHLKDQRRWTDELWNAKTYSKSLWKNLLFISDTRDLSGANARNLHKLLPERQFTATNLDFRCVQFKNLTTLDMDNRDFGQGLTTSGYDYILLRKGLCDCKFRDRADFLETVSCAGLDADPRSEVSQKFFSELVRIFDASNLKNRIYLHGSKKPHRDSSATFSESGLIYDAKTVSENIAYHKIWLQLAMEVVRKDPEKRLEAVSMQGMDGLFDGVIIRPIQPR